MVTSLEKIAGAEQSLLNLALHDPALRTLVISLGPLDGISKLAITARNPNIEFVSLGCRKMIWPRQIRELRSLIADFSPGLVISWMYHANVAASLALLFRRGDYPLLWSVHHGLDRFADESRSTKLAIIASTLLARFPFAISYVSKAVARQHRKAFFLAKRHVVVPNSIKFPMRPTFRLSKGRPTVGIAARHHPIKDYPYFFAIASELKKRVPDVRILACGAGVDKMNSAICNEIRSAGLSGDCIELLGELKDIAQFYRELDVLLLTSKSEAFGMVLAEAICEGALCAAKDTGAAREIIGEAGTILPENDPKLAATAIIELLEKPQGDKEKLVESQSEWLRQRFSPQAVSQQLRALVTPLPSSRHCNS